MKLSAQDPSHTLLRSPRPLLLPSSSASPRLSSSLAQRCRVPCRRSRHHHRHHDIVRLSCRFRPPRRPSPPDQDTAVTSIFEPSYICLAVSSVASKFSAAAPAPSPRRRDITGHAYSIPEPAAVVRCSGQVRPTVLRPKICSYPSLPADSLLPCSGKNVH
jgi:hypothetical protein